MINTKPTLFSPSFLRERIGIVDSIDLSNHIYFSHSNIFDNTFHEIGKIEKEIYLNLLEELK